MIIAGTGHRPNKLGGYSISAHNNLVDIAYKWLIENKPSLVISGMALGWDQALAEAAIKRGIPFDAYVPFYGQESHWPFQSQTNYHKLLKLANKIVMCSDGGYTPYKMQLRNEKMVDACDTVLAMYNGTNGGTGNCIKYAIDHNKPIINLYQNYLLTLNQLS